MPFEWLDIEFDLFFDPKEDKLFLWPHIHRALVENRFWAGYLNHWWGIVIMWMWWELTITKPYRRRVVEIPDDWDWKE